MTREEFVGLVERYNTVERLGDGRFPGTRLISEIKALLFVMKHERTDSSLDIKDITIKVRNKYRSNKVVLKHSYGNQDKAELFLYQNMLDRLIYILEEYIKDCEYVIEESAFPDETKP